MKISVIIPVYNVETFLPRCLDSVFGQTYQDFELICINDCSPDNSLKILRDYETRYPDKMIVLDNQKNIGQGLSRKKAIDVSKGEYIVFIDSDDYVAPDYLATYLKEMETYDCDVAVSGFTKDIDGTLIENDSPIGAWSVLTYSISCAKMFRAAFLKENDIHYSDIRRGEDIYFGMSQFYHDIRIHNFKYYGYYYYLNRNSTTGSLNYEKEHEKDIAEIFDKFLRDYDISLCSKEKKEFIIYTYVSNMVNALVTYGHGCKPAIMKKKYEFFISDMKNRFPDYKSNSLYGIRKPEGQIVKIRLGVGVTMMLHKVGLDKLMFYIISLI